MGGNALSVPTVRLTRKQYIDFEDLVVLSLERGVCKHVAAVRSYAKKPDFGDMDILYVPHDSTTLENMLHSLKPVEVVRNGDVTSVGLEYNGVFQVDLIKCQEEYFDWASTYFAFNDLGNLMGRIAHKMGFKYGHDGFWYVLRDEEHPTQVVKEILVSRDEETVFDFLGYDYQRFLEGFDTLEDIFEFVVSSPYFNKDIYLLDNRNHTARVRDRKRKTYMQFLAWCEEKEFNNFKWEESGTVEREVQKRHYLSIAADTWPSFNLELMLCNSKHRMRKEAKKKFNGEVVAGVTGLEGKALGQFIAEFKKSWLGEDNFWHYMYEARPDEIEKAIRRGYDENQCSTAKGASQVTPTR